MGTITKEKTIGASRYLVTQLTGWKALFMSRRLGALLGPTMARGLASAKGMAEKDVLAAAERMGPAVELLFEKLTEDELREVVRGLLETAIVIRKENGKLSNAAVLDVFDEHFQGNLLELFQLLRFAFEVNFGNFLGALLGFAKPYLAEAPSPQSSESPSESKLAGRPGASSSSA